ncbi:MAG: hypothetical protein KKB20_26120 [Proteobacteria bacterium]|nr:hypothetical protein [Pseudomonadota bacterium]
MAWMEMIQLRCTEPPRRLLGRELPAWAEEARRSEGLAEFRAFVHAVFPGDLCLLLMWDAPRPGSGASPLGRGLVEVLKTAGLVDRSVWIEWLVEADE